MRRVSVIVGVALLTAAAIVAGLVRWRTRSEPGVPAYAVVEVTPGAGSNPPESLQIDPALEFRWSRPGRSAFIDEHHGSTKADWVEQPEAWAVRPLDSFDSISADVRTVLEAHDCSVPQMRGGSTAPENVVWGEIERRGQRDLIVLCAHKDRTSASYIVWNGDPSRLEVGPWIGSSITLLTRADVEQRLDVAKPLQPDTPEHAEHDAVRAACCECCSTIYYRHNDEWLTLPGGD